MKMNKIITSILIALALALPASLVYAQMVQLINPDVSGPKTETETKPIAEQLFDPATNATTMTQIVADVIQVFLGLLGTIFVVLIVLAGYNWMTANGDKGKVDKAQYIMRTAIIGIVIIVAAYAITYWIFSRLPDGRSQKNVRLPLNTPFAVLKNLL